MPYLIGITGNSGCGKSTALAILREAGYRVMDFDAYSIAVIQEAGNPVLFPAAMFEKLRSLEGNRGGASLLREEDRKSKGIQDKGIQNEEIQGEGIQDKGIQNEGVQVLIVEAGSPYELMDVDSPEDLAELEAVLHG